MVSIPAPGLAKCLAFMGVGQSHLNTFEGFRDWVIANHQHGTEVNAPGNTGWQYQVPFWTSNARGCAQRFGRYTHQVKKPTTVDDATGLKLMHGYWCTGRDGNNAYSVLLERDLENGKYRTSAEQIASTTIGAKFYCYEEKPNKRAVHPYCTEPQLSVVAMTLRVADDGSLLCIPLMISSNLYFVGGHGSETRADCTYQGFLAGEGWSPHLGTWDWTSYRSSQRSADIDHVKEVHSKFFDRMFIALA